jgi:hypothetical protein
MTMEPGTPAPSTLDRAHCTGHQSAPPGNALAPPTVLFPAYPLSTLNNYYQQSSSFLPYNQNNMHILAPVTLDFFDPNILPPSASQTHVPTIRHTLSSSLQSISNTRNSQNQIDTHSPANTLSPLIFQTPITKQYK